MRIQYIDGTNLAYCNGYKFRKDRKTGYWLCTTLRVRLHRYVWQQERGEIPKGYQVHHKDGNKDNNAIDNLELMTAGRHSRHHGALLTDEEREWRRRNVVAKAVPVAAKRTRTPEQLEWHKMHYEKIKHKLHVERDFNCELCGKGFKSIQVNSRFCSNACKSKWRRDNGLDNVDKNCVICGVIFVSNKYHKSETCNKSCAMKLAYKRRGK